MTPAELTAARERMGLNMSQMAKQLKTKYRTYQDWEYGRRRIPGIVEAAVELLLQKDAWLMRRTEERLSKAIYGLWLNRPRILRSGRASG